MVRESLEREAIYFHYRHPESKVQGHRDKVNGTQAVPLAQYEKHLEELVQQLKKTGAKLIWASTTVVPEGEAGRFVGDDVKYNEVARRIMEKHGIPIDDLHALTASVPGFGAEEPMGSPGSRAWSFHTCTRSSTPPCSCCAFHRTHSRYCLPQSEQRRHTG